MATSFKPKRKPPVLPSKEIAALHNALLYTTSKPLDMEAIKVILRAQVNTHALQIESATRPTGLIRAGPYLSETFAAAAQASNPQISALVRQYTALRLQLMAILAQIEGSMSTGPALYQSFHNSRHA